MKKFNFLYVLPVFFAINLAQAHDGLALGLEGGLAGINGLPSQAAAGAINIERSFPYALRISLGYNHDFNRLFGIGFEGGLSDFGQTTTYYFPILRPTSVYFTSVEFLATGMWHVCPKFDLIGKLGGLRLSPNVGGSYGREGDTRVVLQAGLEGAYNISQHFAITLSVAHVFGQTIASPQQLYNNVPSLNEGFVGLRYRFGE